MPKLLLSSFFLFPIGFVADNRLGALVVYALTFIAGLSFLGHKEWRFIVYVVPMLNVAAARGARTLSVSPILFGKFLLRSLTPSVSLRKGELLGRLCFAALVLMLFADSGYTLLYTQMSLVNYPGGASLVRFNEHYRGVDNGISPHNYTETTH